MSEGEVVGAELVEEDRLPAITDHFAEAHPGR